MKTNNSFVVVCQNACDPQDVTWDESTFHEGDCSEDLANFRVGYARKLQPDWLYRVVPREQCYWVRGSGTLRWRGYSLAFKTVGNRLWEESSISPTGGVDYERGKKLLKEAKIGSNRNLRIYRLLPLSSCLRLEIRLRK